MAAYPPDLLIEVPRTACRSLEFHRAAEVIDLGRELAAKALDGCRNTLTSRNSVTAAANRRPCSRPASADGSRHRGSSRLGPKAASDSSSAKTAKVRARKAAISAAVPLLNGDGVDSLAGTSTTAVAVCRHGRLTELVTPPSMSGGADGHRRPGAGHRAAGGYRVDQFHPGRESNTTNSAVAVSIAVIRRSVRARWAATAPR